MNIDHFDIPITKKVITVKICYRLWNGCQVTDNTCIHLSIFA